MLEGIRRRVGEGVRVEYAEGIDPITPADLLPGPPLVPSSVLTPVGSDPHVRGLQAEYWTTTRFEVEPQLVRTDRQVNLNLGLYNFMNASSVATPMKFNFDISVRWRGSLTVPITGEYTLSLTHLGTARLYLDGQLLIDDPGVTLQTQSVTLSLEAFQPHALQIDYAADRPEQVAPEGISMTSVTGSQVCLGWKHPAGVIPPAMQEAAALAGRSDVAGVGACACTSAHTQPPRVTLSKKMGLFSRGISCSSTPTRMPVGDGVTHMLA